MNQRGPGRGPSMGRFHNNNINNNSNSMRPSGRGGFMGGRNNNDGQRGGRSRGENNFGRRNNDGRGRAVGRGQPFGRGRNNNMNFRGGMPIPPIPIPIPPPPVMSYMQQQQHPHHSIVPPPPPPPPPPRGFIMNGTIQQQQQQQQQRQPLPNMYVPRPPYGLAAPPMPLQNNQFMAGVTSNSVTTFPVQYQLPQAPPAAAASSTAIYPPVTTTTIPLTTQPGIATVTSGTAVTASTPQQVDDAWKEYTAENGTKYYHNSILNQSTYTKPDVMVKREASVAAVAAAAAAAVSASSNTTPSSEKRPWQEYEDATTGRKYYSDGVTTTWVKPEGFISPDEIVASTLVQEEKKKEPIKKKAKRSDSGNIKKEIITYSSKEEATAGLKGLFLAKGISPILKWNEVVKLCESDSRWIGCEIVLSVGERRQALAEYQTKRASEIKSEQRQEKARAKDAFGQLLTDTLPKIPGFSARAARFETVRKILAKDDRFHAVEDEATRELLFVDFCDDLKKREERKKRNKKREAQESFISFLEEKEESGSLTYASTWESFLLSLNDAEKSDQRFATSSLLPESNRQLYFADFVLALQKAEDDKRRRIRDARRWAEKAQRDKYRDLLKVKAKEGKIFPYSRWRVVEELISQDESFTLVQAQDRNSPREVFEAFVDEWDDVYRRERSFLARLLDPVGKEPFVVTEDTTFDAFNTFLKNEASHSDEIQTEVFRIINREDPVSSARLFYDELVYRASEAGRYGSRRPSTKDDSSEDEGEIIEEGEISDDNEADKHVPETDKAGTDSKVPDGSLQYCSDTPATNTDKNQDSTQEPTEKP